MSDDFAAFRRTPEQMGADAARLADEVEREKLKDARRGGPPVAPVRLSGDGDLNQAIASVMAKAGRVEETRRSLPCYAPSEAGDVEGGVAACEAARAFDKCPLGAVYQLCPRLQAVDQYDAAKLRLSRAGVRRHEREVILAAVRRETQLSDVDALRVMRGILRARRMAVHVDDAREVRDGELAPAGDVYLTGDERIAVFGGNVGRGKTIAACYAIAYRGGLYTVAGQWSRPGLDLEAAKVAPVLVIDQLGREYAGERADYMRSQLEEVLDARVADRRLTVCAGNFDLTMFIERCQKVIVDRVAGFGVFVLFAGDSLRPQLRARALGGG
jgi:hypothetical protein